MLSWLGAVAGAAAEPPTIEGLGWLAGCWRGHANGVVMEEIWMAPEGGVMLGLHRDVFPSGEVFFEYLRIESDGGQLTYLASPRGRDPTVFAVVEVGRQRVAFENPDHDFPRRISYWLEDQVLNARAEGADGGPRAAQWAWSRVACPAGG